MWALQSIMMFMFWKITRPTFHQIKIGPLRNNFLSSDSTSNLTTINFEIEEENF